jgi:hypothetical protein
MGRYYSGSIEGKFWFGIQSSNDIENLINIQANEPKLLWIGCNCYIEDEKDEYCKDCYGSLEDFLDKEGEYIENGIHFYEDNEISYDIDESYLQELKTKLESMEITFDTHLKELCNKLPNNLQNAFDGHFDEITTYVSEKENQPLGKMATYCLGRQIKACLENEGQCSVYCEL